MMDLFVNLHTALKETLIVAFCGDSGASLVQAARTEKAK